MSWVKIIMKTTNNIFFYTRLLYEEINIFQGLIFWDYENFISWLLEYIVYEEALSDALIKLVVPFKIKNIKISFLIYYER